MIEKLTKKQIELQAIKRDEWINIALYKQDVDKEEIEAGVKWLYYASNLKEPKVIIVTGPKDFAKKFSASVGASVRASVGASVRDSVWDSVRDSVGASVRASVWDSVWASVRDSVSICSQSYDADFAAWCEYYKEIGAIKTNEKTDKYLGYLRSGAFYVFFFEKVAFVMLKPTIVKQDEQKRLHSENGPALAFADGTEIYKLHGVTFDKKWHNKIVNDKFKAKDVFAIDNLEHRRIAYDYMDKSKMRQLKNYKILDEQVDDKGNPMKIISFTVPNVNEPLKYYNCFCPSTKREYFIGTNFDTCEEAKAQSFGLKAGDVEFINEW
jgi:hypothetical protein